MKNLYLCFTLLSLAMFVGCQEEIKGPRTVEASGVVTLDGEPVEGASVVFVGENGQYSASALSESDGSFSLNAFEYKTGAVPGSYMAAVTKTVEVETNNTKKMSSEEAEHSGDAAGQIVKNAMPKKYEIPSKSFSFVIPEEGTSDLKVELTSK